MSKKKVSRRSNKSESKSTAEVTHFNNFKEIPVSCLVQAEWNYKKQDERLQEKLAANMRKNGQIENILVRHIGDGKYEVVNGNHRFLALQSLGVENAVVYDLGEIPLAAAQRIAIETNETKFESDNVVLAELLRDIQEEFGLQELAETMPYDEKELENFNALLDFNWEDEEKEDEDEEKGDGSKSSTVVSAGGEKFRTIKLELDPVLADKLEEQIARLKPVCENRSEAPIELIVNFLSKHDVKDIVAASDSRKAAKRAPKKAATKK